MFLLIKQCTYVHESLLVKDEATHNHVMLLKTYLNIQIEIYSLLLPLSVEEPEAEYFIWCQNYL